MFHGLSRALGDLLANALGRSTARSISEALEGWWGWAPLFAAIAVGLAAYFVLRAVRHPRGKMLSAALSAATFVVAALLGPIMRWQEVSTITSSGREAVLSELVDPSSARLSFPLIRRQRDEGVIACGWLNAKATNGAYQGPQIVAVSFNADREIESVAIDSACRTNPLSGDSCDRTTRAGFMSLSRAASQCTGLTGHSPLYPP